MVALLGVLPFAGRDPGGRAVTLRVPGVDSDVEAGGTFLVPYGLGPPSKLILPCTDRNRRLDSKSVSLGPALLTRDEFGACNCAGEHPAGIAWTLRIPYASGPHCDTCECAEAQIIRLSEQDVTNLRELLA